MAEHTRRPVVLVVLALLSVLAAGAVAWRIPNSGGQTIGTWLSASLGVAGLLLLYVLSLIHI